MEIIKEFSAGQSVAILRTSTYAHSLDHFLKLAEAAKADFPHLKPSEIKIVHYGGKRYRGTFGIEFQITDPPPESYTRIPQTEPNLG